MTVSGFYLEKTTNNRVRLDVDGTLPQQRVSGLIYFREQSGKLNYLYWYAKMTWDAANKRGRGDVDHVFWNKDEAGSWYRTVEIEIQNTNPATLKIVWSGGGHASLTATYEYTSSHFQEAYVEFDYQTGYQPVKAIRPRDVNPDNPQQLPETLTLEEVFLQSGIRIFSTGKDNEVTGEPSTKVWSNAALHDRLKANFSLWNQDPKAMAVWAFSSTLVMNQQQTAPDNSVGGRMFDAGSYNTDGRPRQGMVLCFESSMLKQSTPTLSQWMAFVSLVHELGHCFNLNHSFEKNVGTPWLASEVKGDVNDLSFMNYYYNYDQANVPGGYLKRFRHRFTDSELLFLRHAPKWFLYPGYRDSDDSYMHHAGIIDPDLRDDRLQLQLGPTSGGNVFDFLEPVSLDLSLTNRTGNAIEVDHHWLTDSKRTSITIAREGGAARRWSPFTSDCYISSPTPLQTGERITATLPAWFGTGGPMIADPGFYVAHATTYVGDQLCVARPFHFRVLAPSSREEDRYAQDYFSPDVARVMQFGGSQFCTAANDVLRTLAEAMPNVGSAAKDHARVALLLPHTYAFPRTEIGSDGRPHTRIVDPDPSAVAQLRALIEGASSAVRRSLGTRTIDELRLRLQQQL